MRRLVGALLLILTTLALTVPSASATCGTQCGAECQALVDQYNGANPGRPHIYTTWHTATCNGIILQSCFCQIEIDDSIQPPPYCTIASRVNTFFISYSDDDLNTLVCDPSFEDCPSE
jgi:hypothetical protein